MLDGDPQATFNKETKHFTDKWKTPFHKSFSKESIYADPEKAPEWQQEGKNSYLVSPAGEVLYREGADGRPLK